MVDQLLQELAVSNYEMVVLTTAVSICAQEVLDMLDKNKLIDHRLYRESCTPTTDGLVKALSKHGRDLNNVFLVDDNTNFNLIMVLTSSPLEGTPEIGSF